MAFKDEVSSLDRIAAAVEALEGGGGGSDLPTPTVADAGKALVVGSDGSYELGAPSVLEVEILLNEENKPTMNKKAGEIYAAAKKGPVVVKSSVNPFEQYGLIVMAGYSDEAGYGFTPSIMMNTTLVAATADDYPTCQSNP